MISVYRADQLKRFAPFSYLNHSFTLSLNVKACIRFTAFLQISLCFFCQEVCWTRDLCISFTSSCFLFPVGEGSKNFEDGGELKHFRTGGLPIWGKFLLGGSTPLHAMNHLNHFHSLSLKQLVSRV